MATFVLVHGAFHGGWCWRDVAARLRAAGHVVFAPTLTGLGARSHLAAPASTSRPTSKTSRASSNGRSSARSCWSAIPTAAW